MPNIWETAKNKSWVPPIVHPHWAYILYCLLWNLYALLLDDYIINSKAFEIFPYKFTINFFSIWKKQQILIVWNTNYIRSHRKSTVAEFLAQCMGPTIHGTLWVGGFYHIWQFLAINTVILIHIYSFLWKSFI